MAKETSVANETPNNTNKTPKSIVLQDADGNTYTLQYNRKVVYNMQKSGFELDFDRLYMCARDLIAGAFRMHHPWMKWDEIEAVWMAQDKKSRSAIVGHLANMFSAPALDLMGDATEDGEPENPTFKINY